jgi:hypothetical protein
VNGHEASRTEKCHKNPANIRQDIPEADA